MYFSGCSENSTNNNDSYMLKADVSLETWQLFFKTNNVQFSNLNITGGTQRTLTGVMTSATETYTLILSVNDLGTGAKTYYLTDPQTEAQAALSWTKDNKVFNTKLSGAITLTKLTDNEWVGTFHFEATEFSTSKMIKVINGIINSKK
jgi:hypothetical protein